MAATLKICIMVHVEDKWRWEGGGVGTKAEALSSLAEVIGTPGRDAKLSVQFGRNFLDHDSGDDEPYPLDGPTVLATILHRGGNFWTHTHSSDYGNLVANLACVRSAWYNEGGPTSYGAGGPGGRSGGWDFNGADWVSITLQAGLRLMNSSVMGAHALVPTSLRPYDITDEEIEKLYPKGQAPGPIYSDVMTMRQRPFWMDVASNWFARTDTTYPSTLYVGSVMMIPGPGKMDLPNLTEGRTAFNTTVLTETDLKCALTQAWATQQNMVHQESITNVWYTHFPILNIDNDTTSMVGYFVESLNFILGVHETPKRAEWKNMNEIGTLFADPQSFYW